MVGAELLVVDSLAAEEVLLLELSPEEAEEVLLVAVEEVRLLVRLLVPPPE